MTALMSRGRQFKRGGAALATVALCATGCHFNGAYSLPLPGGASHGKQVVVHAVFNDVQDLVPKNSVRVDDVAVGTITAITLDPKTYKADVTLSINAPTAANLPYNSVATLQQTSLLGEKFVALAPPKDPIGKLTNGEHLPASGSTLPDVEEIFGALSAVLNGGDLQDLQEINIEVTNTLQGREQDVRGALSELSDFVTDLDGQRSQINSALTQLNRLSSELASQTTTISTALTNLGPGLQVLANEEPQFTRLLVDLSSFGKTATKVINASRTDTVHDLSLLKPVLSHLAAAGSNLPHALELLVTYPFPRNIGADAPGDYTGLDLSFDAGQGTVLSQLCTLLEALGVGGLDTACPSTTTTSPLSLQHLLNPGRTGSGKAPRVAARRSKSPASTPSPNVSVPQPTPSGLLPGLLGKLSRRAQR